MIHSIYTMTIGRYGQLDKTQNANLLRRWFNPLPVSLFRKSINKFFESVKDIFAEDEVNNELTDQVERLYMVNKMLQISVLYDALYAIMILKAGVDITLLMLNREPKEATNLEYFKSEVKELTGIEVNDFMDLQKIKDELTRMADKFKERFPDEEEVKDKPSFYRAAIRIFSLVEMSYNDKMTLAEFAELKKEAAERRKSLEKLKEKYATA